MAGIKLTPQRRSELLRILLAQNAQQQNPQTGIEAALRLGANAIRQGQANKLQEAEASRQSQIGANTANLASILSGGNPTDFQGRAIQGATSQPTKAQAIAQTLKVDPTNAVAMAALSQEMQQPKQENPWAKINPKDFTPKSVAAFESTGRMSDLVPRQKDPLVEVNTGEKRGESLLDLQPNTLKFLSEGSDEIATDYESMLAANRALENLNEGVFTGMAQPAQDTIARMLSIVTDKKNPPQFVAETLRRLAASQEFDANGGVLVGSIIRLFGSGTGLSDADREYAAQIAGALRNRDEASLRRILGNVMDAKKRAVSRWNTKLKKMQGNSPIPIYDAFGYDMGAKTAEDYIRDAAAN